MRYRFLFNSKAFRLVYENDVDVFIPQMWANESLGILVENLIAGSLVYRDFENVLAQYGDVVNVRKPGTFQAYRKTNADNVVIQDAIATNVQVPLDQHVHTSFLIRDGEESQSFKDLVDEFLRPAIIAQAQFIDKMVLGQYAQFLTNSSGGLGQLTNNNGKNYLLSLRQVMNQNRAPVDNRNLILNSVSETTLLGMDLFLQAQQVGDDGTALRNASLGRKLGFDIFMDQNMPTVLAGANTTSAGAINNAAGYPAGNKGPFTVDGITGIITTGTWFTVAGDYVPHRVTAHTETTSNTTSITTDTALSSAVADNAVITFYTPGAVNNVAGYAAGYAKEITVSGFTVAPQVGQAVTFGGNLANFYTIIRVNGLVGIVLDRPLAVAIANTDAVNLGPAGAFNFAFHRNAIALVVRPLAKPRQGTGALSAVVNWNNLSMRVVITYDGNAQGHLVTVDMLCGIAILDKALGAVLYG